MHLEEDTGKNTHVGTSGRIHGADYSLVDFNRAGIPLVEIVTKPVAGTGALAPEVARAYVTELRDLLRTLGVSDVRMEQGSLRCDVNTSLNRPGEEWGTRTETKNVNSLRSVERAVRTEMIRQADLLDAGEKIHQETRHFSETTGDTRPGRSKEEATDYRYFPEPDLVPLAPDPAWVEQIRASLPELPAARRARISEQLGVSADDMRQMANAGVVDLVGATVEAGAPVGEARNWWLGYLAQRANERDIDAADLGITPVQVARVVALVADGSLSSALARQVVDAVLETGSDVDAIIAERGLKVVSDSGALGAAADDAIAANPDVAEKVRGGKVAAVGPARGCGDEGDAWPGGCGGGARTPAGATRGQLTATLGVLVGAVVLTASVGGAGSQVLFHIDDSADRRGQWHCDRHCVAGGVLRPERQRRLGAVLRPGPAHRQDACDLHGARRGQCGLGGPRGCP